MPVDKKIYGHINCPHCHYPNGMRITADKHGDPFGFCEANCDGQMRIGGKPRRVEAFFKAHPHIAAAFKGEPEPEKIPVTDTGNSPEPEAKTKPSFSLDSL